MPTSRTCGGSIGAVVRVGGLVADLQPGGFRLDDGTAVGTVLLRGAAADLLALIETGDAINVTGRVETVSSGPGSPGSVVLVEDPAGVALAGDPTAPSRSVVPSMASAGPMLGDAGSAAGHHAAGLTSFPGEGAAGAAGLGTLVGLTAASLVVTVLRRRRVRGRVAARVASRLAVFAGPSGRPAGPSGGPRSAEHDPRTDDAA